jgi:hypothetical protein
MTMGVKMAVPVLGAWVGLSAGLRTHKREANALLLDHSDAGFCAAIVSGRDAAKFLDPIVETFDQVALR